MTRLYFLMIDYKMRKVQHEGIKGGGKVREALQATKFLDSQHPDVIDRVRFIVKDTMDDVAKAVQLFHFVRDGIRYNMYACAADSETLKASYVLQQGEGWCLQKAILLATLARAADIPARLIITTIKNHKAPPEVWKLMGTNVFFPHAYNLLYLDGHWVKAAATFDAELCQRLEVPVANFDGRSDAILPARDVHGSPFIEYIGEQSLFDDLPLKWIIQHSREVYGDYYANWLG